jgi:hypothetical protein
MSGFMLEAVLGLNYETDVQIGENIIYKRHDRNSSTQTWSSWSYLLYKVVELEDPFPESGNETHIKAKRWLSEDTIHWRQMPFYNSFSSVTSPEELSEVGTIARLSEIPIVYSVGLNNEEIIIRSGIKIGTFVNHIDTTLEELSEGDFQVRINSIHDGYGIMLVETGCGCAIEGGVSKRVRNITYTPRGLLKEYFFFEQTDYGADAEASITEYEQFLVEDLDFNNVILENLSIGWKNSYLPTISTNPEPKTTPINIVIFLFSLSLIIFYRNRPKSF